MKIARFVKQSFCFLVRNENICKSIMWEDPEQMLLKSVAKFAHKILFDHEPAQLFEMFRPPRSRPTANIGITYQPRTAKAENTLIFKSHRVYNALPENMRALKPSLFKVRLKKLRLELT